MPVKKVKPTSNARREMSVSSLDVDKKNPEKSLSFGISKSGGRNCYGRITTRNRGGGAKRLYRKVDFDRTPRIDQQAEVEALEYDPNRSAVIALIKYQDGHLEYVLAPQKLKRGAKIICSEKAPARVGNRMKLKNIPPSTEIFNIEITQGRGGESVRSAGSSATLMGFDGKYAIVKMPSGEIRRVLSECFATVGAVSNPDHSSVVVGKAGRKRNMGRRPKVRGKAKNPCDHPHGGGEGRAPIGMSHPKTPWGMPALGRKTRKKDKSSDALIIERRKK